jgi:hypothetical protein
LVKPSGATRSAVSKVAARSAMASTGALVFHDTIDGMTETSATRRFEMPRILTCASTDIEPFSIWHVPTGWR